MERKKWGTHGLERANRIEPPRIVQMCPGVGACLLLHRPFQWLCMESGTCGGTKHTHLGPARLGCAPQLLVLQLLFSGFSFRPINVYIVLVEIFVWPLVRCSAVQRYRAIQYTL